MLRIDRQAKKLFPLKKVAMPAVGLKERDDLQTMIRHSPDDFFAEMGFDKKAGTPLLLIGEETRPTDWVDDRIDLLAIDSQGVTVVIELKRGSDKLQLLQALSYAAMVATWSSERVIEQRAALTKQSVESARIEILEFVGNNVDGINSTQRILLVAEHFDYEVLVTAEWLNVKHGVDVRCYRLAISVDGDREYLACACVYPPQEITDHLAERRGPAVSAWPDWDAALVAIENEATRAFFQEQRSKCENNLAHREIYYRISDQRRLTVGARKDNAYVWQAGRFPKDVEFWKARLTAKEKVNLVNQNRAVRFYLESAEDFKVFLEAVSNHLPNFEFHGDHEETGPIQP